jgi:predicted  nucleic acid-binding Zn-ribbon protein
VLDSDSADSGADIAPALAEASGSLSRMIENALEVNAPILEAMSGVQLQDIIRQSIDQILLALPELQDLSGECSVEERLDRLTLDEELLDICLRISADVLANLDSSLSTFSSNWNRVHEILDSVERSRVEFIERYLDTRNLSGKSIPAILDAMTNGFSEYISHINLYQRGQKTMVRESALIVTQVKHLRVLFDSIKPIIARLQHVRITQQIEVAKNPAIAAVKDTVDHMSELIMQADVRVQDTRRELEEFIEGIDVLTSGYSAGAETDHRILEKLKQEKTLFFGKMKEYQDELAQSVVHLEVYPDSFQSLCTEIDAMLGELKSLRDSVEAAKDRLDAMHAQCKSDRDRLVTDSGLGDWQIHNDRFRAMVQRFTITSHKEAAGEIGGFDVDKGLDSIESGDVTLFF